MYTSGQATSYSDLLNALVDACRSQGWNFSDGILSKNKAFVKIYSNTTPTGSIGEGIIIQGGTGKNGSNVLNPSPAEPRLGSAGANGVSEAVAFPCAYNIHIFNDPDEVFLVINFNIDKFYYLSFGMSSILEAVTPTGGLWLAGSVSKEYDLRITNNIQGFTIGYSNGGSNINYAYAGFFWTSSATSISRKNEIINTGLNGKSWQTGIQANNIESVDGISAVYKIIARLPSAWSVSSPLLPINLINYISSSKTSLVCTIGNARYLRIDNYEPGQIISLGNERWKIYPFHRKNAGLRDGGVWANHTGTFGWAIRYDGP